MTTPHLTSPDIPAADLIAYADVVLDLGAPVREDDLVVINAEIDHAPLARALAEGAYARGARYVDIWYFDPHANDPGSAIPTRRPCPRCRPGSTTETGSSASGTAS